MSPWLSDLFLGSQSDERLVSLARAGHDRAFVAIAARYKHQLVRFAHRLGAESSAEDIVQQALMSALTALRAGADVHHVRGWLHAIVRNAALKAAVRAALENELSEDLIAADNTEDEVERRLLARTTLAAIAVLPGSQRDAFVRTAVQGRSRSEVALSMGLSEGAVRQLVHRARASLRAGVTAITPYPLAVWAAGARPAAGTSRTAEIIFGAGSGSAGGLALKTGAVVVATGVLATSVVVSHGRPAFSHRAHRAVVEVKAPRARTLPAGLSPAASASALASGQRAVHSVSLARTRSSRHATVAAQVRLHGRQGAGDRSGDRAEPRIGGTSGGDGTGPSAVKDASSGSGQDSGDSSTGASSSGDASGIVTVPAKDTSSGEAGTSMQANDTSGGDAGGTTTASSSGTTAPASTSGTNPTPPASLPVTAVAQDMTAATSGG